MEIKEWLQTHRAAMIEDVMALTAIESVSRPGESGLPFGSGCRKALHRALAMAERYGLDVENLDDYCGSAVLKGKSVREIGFFSHLVWCRKVRDGRRRSLIIQSQKMAGFMGGAVRIIRDRQRRFYMHCVI